VRLSAPLSLSPCRRGAIAGSPPAARTRRSEENDDVLFRFDVDAVPEAVLVWLKTTEGVRGL